MRYLSCTTKVDQEKKIICVVLFSATNAWNHHILNHTSQPALRVSSRTKTVWSGESKARHRPAPCQSRPYLALFNVLSLFRDQIIFIYFLLEHWGTSSVVVFKFVFFTMTFTMTTSPKEGPTLVTGNQASIFPFADSLC